METRRSRDSFTRSLKRICQRLDSQNVFEVDFKYDFLPGLQHSRLRVNALWAAGSYARGALHCGDLDLVADIALEEGTLPLMPAISRCVVGRAPDVRLYIGTPEENTSGVAFSEAKPIWSPESPDWNAAIEAIPADPTAARFKRRYDILPLRKEQITQIGDNDIFDKIVDLVEQEIISPQWVPISEITVQENTWSSAATQFLETIQQWCGKKTQQIMPFAIEWFKGHNECDLWHRDYGEKTRFKIGGAEVFVGHPYIDLNLLECLSCSALVIVPHLTRRGPNGLWILSRGVNHPLEQAFNKCQAYYLADGTCPSIINEIDGWKTIHTLELFHQRVDAESLQREIKDQEDIDFDVAKSSGRELLSIISCVDVVDIDSVRYAITREGQYFDEADNLAIVEEMVLSLSSSHEQISP